MNHPRSPARTTAGPRRVASTSLARFAASAVAYGTDSMGGSDPAPDGSMDAGARRDGGEREDGGVGLDGDAGLVIEDSTFIDNDASFQLGVDSHAIRGTQHVAARRCSIMGGQWGMSAHGDPPVPLSAIPGNAVFEDITAEGLGWMGFYMGRCHDVRVTRCTATVPSHPTRAFYVAPEAVRYEGPRTNP